eukprot:1293277-Prymnesium_polylepis.2
MTKQKRCHRTHEPRVVARLLIGRKARRPAAQAHVTDTLPGRRATATQAPPRTRGWGSARGWDSTHCPSGWTLNECHDL